MEEGKEGREAGIGKKMTKMTPRNAPLPASPRLASHHDHDYYSDDKVKESC